MRYSEAIISQVSGRGAVNKARLTHTGVAVICVLSRFAALGNLQIGLRNNLVHGECTTSKYLASVTVADCCQHTAEAKHLRVSIYQRI